MAFRSLPIEAFPDVTDVQAAVITLFPGHAPEEVEKQVTIPLETELSGLPHSVRLFSHTQFGLSFIYITFDDAVTDYFARQQVLERLQNADLPDGVKPQLAPLASPIGEVYRFYLKSDTLNATDLRSIEDWTVERSCIPTGVRVPALKRTEEHRHVSAERMRVIGTTWYADESARLTDVGDTGGQLSIRSTVQSSMLRRSVAFSVSLFR